MFSYDKWMGKIKQFAGQTMIYGLSHILSRIFYFLLITVFLTRLLGGRTEEFGVYEILYGYSTVLLFLFSFRLDTALFRYGNKNENKAIAFNTTFSTVILAAIGIAVAGTLLAQPIANLIRFSDQPHYVRWFSYIIAFDIMSLIPFAKLRIDGKAKRFAIYKVFNIVFSCLLVLFFLIVLPKYQDDLFSFVPALGSEVAYVFIANLIASLIQFLLLLNESKGFEFKIDSVLFKKMAYYSFPLVIVSIANALIQYFSAPLQDMYVGRAEAGVYGVTRRIASLFVMFTTAFNYAAEPFFFNNSSDKDKKELYGTICRLFVLVGGLIIISIYASLDIIKLIFPADYWGTFYLLPMLLLAYLLLGIYYNVSIWYKLADKTKYGAYISIIGLIINLSISIFFLPKVGVQASVWATLASYLVMVVIAYQIGQKKFPIYYPLKKIIINLAIILACIGSLIMLRNNMPQYVIVGNVILLLGYLVYGYLTEKVMWKSLLSK